MQIIKTNKNSQQITTYNDTEIIETSRVAVIL